jgi:hypothetical protein
MRIHEGTIGAFYVNDYFLRSSPDASQFAHKAFMFESSLMLPLTDYATKRSGVLYGELCLALGRIARFNLATSQNTNRKCGMVYVPSSWITWVR